MFSRISGEFDRIEFAEFAAKHIRETVNGAKKITIFPNKNKFTGHLENSEKSNAEHGEVFYLLPTAINSYNYITARMVRPVDTSLISEPLLTESVKIDVVSDTENMHQISQILQSEGGYDIKIHDNYSNKN